MLADLPQQVALHILGFLPVDELTRDLPRANRHIRRLTAAALARADTLELQAAWQLQPRRVAAYAGALRRLKTLRVGASSAEWETQATSERARVYLTILLRRNASTIRVLEVQAVHLRFLELPARLEELRITDDPSRGCRRRELRSLPERAPHLTVLRVVDDDGSPGVRRGLIREWRTLLRRHRWRQHARPRHPWSTLRRLELSARTCPTHALTSFARELPALRDITVLVGALDTPRDLALLLAGLPRLERAHLTYTRVRRRGKRWRARATAAAATAPIESALRWLAVETYSGEATSVLAEIFGALRLPHLETLSAGRVRVRQGSRHLFVAHNDMSWSLDDEFSQLARQRILLNCISTCPLLALICLFFISAATTLP